MPSSAISFQIRTEASWQDSKRKVQHFAAELYLSMAMNSVSVIKAINPAPLMF